VYSTVLLYSFVYSAVQYIFVLIPPCQVSWQNLKPAMGGVQRQAPSLDMECEGVAEWEVVGVAAAGRR